jgi:hypothetical protein
VALRSALVVLVCNTAFLRDSSTGCSAVLLATLRALAVATPRSHLHFFVLDARNRIAAPHSAAQQAVPVRSRLLMRAFTDTANDAPCSCGEAHGTLCADFAAEILLACIRHSPATLPALARALPSQLPLALSPRARALHTLLNDALRISAVADSAAESSAAQPPSTTE